MILKQQVKNFGKFFFAKKEDGFESAKKNDHDSIIYKEHRDSKLNRSFDSYDENESLTIEEILDNLVENPKLNII